VRWVLTLGAPDYVAADHFHFIDYPGGARRIAGLYTRKLELQALSGGEQGLHLHGYDSGQHHGQPLIFRATVIAWSYTLCCKGSTWTSQGAERLCESTG
jgi:hypothetical protein